LVYAARDDPDRAFTWLDRALRQHDAGLLWKQGAAAPDETAGVSRAL
jgi:hypothetical protein